ncbi:MAG: phosphatidate cytidylyltransferase [Spirochaetales bacterium]|nr:phosphatidate cytidylyltransferase [Spirochaetales bacterium]
MNNTQKRFLLFVLALPILACLILVSWQNHLIINFLIMVITVVGTNEVANMFRKAGISVPVTALTAASAILPVVTYLIVIGVLPESIIPLYFLLAGLFVLIFPIFTMASVEFKGLIEAAACSLISLFYPGYFLTYIVRFTGFEHATGILIIFMLMVYLNDSNAWFMGVFFGKNSKRGLFAVSPNKSLIGFIGGIFASCAVTIGAWFLFPDIMHGPLWMTVLLGLVAGMTTILGDLIESGIKRSAGVKDSGSIVMGRGGLLDSIDSLLLTGPVFFYYLYLTSL